MNPITRSLVMEWQEAHRKASGLEGRIVDRIDYVLKTLFEVFGGELDYWYFDGAGEGQVGDLATCISQDTIHNICTEVKNFPDNDMAFIDKDGEEYFWQSEFPTRWLYDDNFKEEIIKGKEEWERREALKKAKKKQTAAAKKEINAKLVAQAKLKLSKEELAALKKAL